LRPATPNSSRPAIGTVVREFVALHRVAVAILPLRLFLGATFLYAGLVKFLDPSFLDPSSASGIAAQLAGFAQSSPLGLLIRDVALQAPFATGVVVAFVEIIAGLGALTGLAPRASAALGFGMSILLWLTASWGVSPFFLGADLPYAIGWLTLALIGDGGIFVLRDFASRAAVAERPAGSPAKAAIPASAGPSGPAAVSRRALLEGVAIAVGALVVATFGWSYGQRRALDETDTPAAAAPPLALGNVATVASAGGLVFTDPQTGDPAVAIALSASRIVAFDTICTHAGCTVDYDVRAQRLICPCHSAAFDPTNHGAVLVGPAVTPLRELTVTIDPTSGQVVVG
jgi:thiosulfate dehydrogenase [quinone] large subunit